jgi:hypothetical protein
MMSNFNDPTFREAAIELLKMTKAAIAEWLRRHGVLRMSMRIGKKP